MLTEGHFFFFFFFWLSICIFVLLSFKFIFNWRIIAFNTGLLSAVQQRESDASIHIYPPSGASLPTSKSSRSTGRSSLGYIAPSHWLSILHMAMYISQCYFLILSHPLLSLVCLQVHFLHLLLYSSCGNRFISTVFLDFTYMH